MISDEYSLGSGGLVPSIFACPICSKTFHRRDLRERHRRRCEKSIGKVRVSRQKSCSSCVASKTRCNLQRPSCQRCLSRGIKCAYKDQTTVGETLEDGLFDPSNEFSVPRVDGAPFADPPFLLGDADVNSYSGAQAGSASQNLQSDISTDQPVSDGFGSNKPGREHTTLVDDFAADLPYIQPLSASENDFSAQSFLEPYLADISNQSGESSGNRNNFIVDEFPSLMPHSHSVVDNIYRSTTSDINSSVDINQQFGTEGMVSISDITHSLCVYPKHMLCPEFSSPFLHQSLYRTDNGYVESWAVSLCCISATSLSLQSSIRFLQDTINKERERLVKGFPVHCTEFAETIPFLHATCVYQILSLLIPHSTYKPGNKPDLSMPELHHSFLVKMARCLLKSVALDHFDTNNIAWHRWVLLESLRRTVFFANLVNEMCFHAKALTHFYFEQVDGTQISRLPLPAPDSMWRARNSAEWTAARDASNWVGVRIPTIERVTKGEMTLSDSYPAGMRPDIVQTIVSCHHWRDRS